MNNKIKELIDKAGTREIFNERYATFVDVFNEEKFAELIVEECATICETASIPIDISVWQNSTKKEMTAVMALELAKLIRQKFGVE